MTSARIAVLLMVGSLVGCSGDDESDDELACEPPAQPGVGDPEGHPEPLGAGPDQARAGRIASAEQLPATTLGLETWKPGDYVLANDRVALVIEAVGASDLYDPWGGRPVGMALVEGGALTAPTDFTELFLMIGRATVVTEAVTVMNDGSDGEPAVIRATGRLAPLPFLDFLLTGFLGDDFRDLSAAIDYTLAPGAVAVDVDVHVWSPRIGDVPSGPVLHGFMFTPRTPIEVPGTGFTSDIGGATWVQHIDDDGASWAYRVPGVSLGGGLAASGFVGAFTDSATIAGCAVTTFHRAHLVIGGPGLDGLEQARAIDEGRALRAITGSVTGIAAGASARVHAHAGTTYVTRAAVNDAGEFTVHVPADQAVTLTAVQAGGGLASVEVEAGATTAPTIALPPPARIALAPVVDADGVIPARIQLFPIGVAAVDIPDELGEPEPPAGRAVVAFSDGQPMTFSVPAGSYRLVVSRGPEYELFEGSLTVGAGELREVAPELERVVDTTGVQCGDFHIHTIRSNDSGDDALLKVRSAMADGVEILVRTDHEYVNSFAPVLEQHGYGAWAMAVDSVEMSSFEEWGHMNVFPLEADPTKVNAGAPQWKVYPSAAEPDAEVRTLPPPEVFAQVRARPERPAIIINHPRGGSNYFDYVGLDAATGVVERPELWDEEFRLIEVFNDSSWVANRAQSVADWFGLLSGGRAVFAVGSSDSHGVHSSPVGYPRTCIAVGSDDPRAITPNLVRDRLSAGHATVSGGIYLDVGVGEAGPGDTVSDAGAQVELDVAVQAATWVDVDTIEVVVDGQTVATIPVTPQDADPVRPVVRWRGSVAIDVAASGSWVVVAAYGDETLEPVHPDRVPFAASNPIFLER